MRSIGRRVIAAVFSIATVLPLAAHPLTLKGTVVAAEPAYVTIRFVDPDSKKTMTESFQIDKETKIVRGDKVVTLAEAGITKGEAIAITVNLDEDEHLADVIRLEIKKK